MSTQIVTTSSYREEFYGKLLKLKEKSRDQKDPLALIIFMTTSLWNSTITKTLAYFICIQILGDLLSFSVQLMMTFDSNFFLRFGGHIGIQIFILVNIGNIIWIADPTIHSITRYMLKILPLKINGKKAYERTSMDSTFLMIFIIIAGILSISNGLLHFFNDVYNEHAVYLINFYRNMLPTTLASFLIFIYKCCFICNPYISVSSALFISYYSFHTAFQLRIIKSFIRKICVTNCEEEVQYYNDTNQECIKQRLKICIMLHQMISREVHTFMKLIYKAILSYTIGVLFVGAGLMLTFLANANDNLSKIMLAIGIFDGFLAIGLYAFNGQMLKDESEELRRELSNLPWYNMNKENKVLYTIFLIRCEKAISFDTNLVQIDYLLMVRIFRALYSVSTIVSRAIHFQR